MHAEVCEFTLASTSKLSKIRIVKQFAVTVHSPCGKRFAEPFDLLLLSYS